MINSSIQLHIEAWAADISQRVGSGGNSERFNHAKQDWRVRSKALCTVVERAWEEEWVKVVVLGMVVAVGCKMYEKGRGRTDQARP